MRTLVTRFRRGISLAPFSSRLPNQEAFDFLPLCLESKFDLTSVDAISSAPRNVLKQFEDGRNYAQFGGVSRGNNFTLQSCVNFFKQQGIECSIDNVALNEHILSGISKTYEALDIKPHEKVLIPTPTFGYYFKQLLDKKIDFETIQTTKNNNFLIDPNQLESAVKRTNSRVLLLCNPNNPTGFGMPKENAEEVASIVTKYDLTVISDGAFLGNNLSEQKQYFSIAALPGMLDRSVTFFSVSKAMSLPLRMSFCVGREDIVNSFGKLGGYETHMQKMLSAALENNEENQEYFRENRKKLLRNIELVKDGVRQVNEKFNAVFNEDKISTEAYVKPYIADPETGGMYLLDFSGLRGKIYDGREMASGLDVSRWLLKDASVGVVPGECSMIPAEEMVVRISLSHDPQVLNRAFDSILLAAEKITNHPNKSPRSPVLNRELSSTKVRG